MFISYIQEKPTILPMIQKRKKRKKKEQEKQHRVELLKKVYTIQTLHQ